MTTTAPLDVRDMIDVDVDTVAGNLARRRPMPLLYRLGQEPGGVAAVWRVGAIPAETPFVCPARPTVP